MTDEQRELAELIATPPTVKLTKRQRIARDIGYIAAVIAIVALVVAAFAGALSIANEQATARQAQCINNILGSRTGVTKSDSAATIAFAKSWQDLLDNQTPGTPGNQAAVAEVTAAIRNYYKTLSDDQAYRDAHPLGQC